MPGIFGAFGLTRDEMGSFVAAHENRWGECDVVTRGRSILGGTMPGDPNPITSDGGQWIGVDGERAASRVGAPGGPEIDDLIDSRGVPTRAASLVLMNPGTGLIRLSADWTGSFPVYWSHHEGTFVFSSVLAPVASVCDADLDPVGLASFVKDGFGVGRRTFYRRISRLQAGQVVEFDASKEGLTVEETSRAWSAEIEDTSMSRPEAAVRIWDGTVASVGSSLSGREKLGLMLSAGWDSRTLLAAALESRGVADLVGVSHGDPAGRELRIVEALCERHEVECMLNRIEESDFDPEYLRHTHGLCGTAQFPYWRTSSRMLSQGDAGCVAAGVLGEVLGGHYGPDMAMSGVRKIKSLAQYLLRFRESRHEASIEEQVPEVRDLFTRGIHTVSRFFDREFWRSVHDLPEAFARAVDDELRRLLDRGVNETEGLIEAYLTEQRGARYINAQLRTARTEAPVALPYAEREVFRLAASIPLSWRIHNRLNRRILDAVRPSLLEYPLAAILVPASAPLVVQEASRGLRKVWEEGQWWLTDVTGGRIPPPRLSWINFEFLEESEYVDQIADDFEWEHWNQDQIRSLADQIQDGGWRGSLHKPVNQLLKMYTVDLSLRS